MASFTYGLPSAELPEYLRSQFSPTKAPKHIPLPMKNFKHGLRCGVSQDSPQEFQGRHTRVLSAEAKDRQRVGNAYKKELLGSELKKFKVVNRPRMDDQDYEGSVNYYSMKLSTSIDFNASQAPRIRPQILFNQKHKERMKIGFGLGRGQFTVHSQQPNVPRNLLHTADAIARTTRYSTSKNIKGFLKTREKSVNQTFGDTYWMTFYQQKRSVSPNSPSKPLRKKRSPRRTVRKSGSIEEFEERWKRVSLNPYDKRMMYWVKTPKKAEN